jgi:hypothetical protein
MRASPSKTTFLKKTNLFLKAIIRKWTFINVQNDFLNDKPKTPFFSFLFVLYNYTQRCVFIYIGIQRCVFIYLPNSIIIMPPHSVTFLNIVDGFEQL